MKSSLARENKFLCSFLEQNRVRSWLGFAVVEEFCHIMRRINTKNFTITIQLHRNHKVYDCGCLSKLNRFNHDLLLYFYAKKGTATRRCHWLFFYWHIWNFIVAVLWSKILIDSHISSSSSRYGSISSKFMRFLSRLI